MRSVFPIACVLVAVTACNPQWAAYDAGAGRDAASELEEDEELTSADAEMGGADADMGGADADTVEPLRDAGDGSERDGSSLIGLPDGDVNDAGAVEDARPAVADGGCADGYGLRNGTCQDIDECFEGTHACHMTATCENTDGGYDCTCPLGYSGGTSAGFACAPRIAVGGVDTGGAGEPHQCVVSIDGQVMCWGDNRVGQLGDGTTTSRMSPVGVLRDAASMSVGGRSACALLVDGTLRCWGDNANGQLGDGTMLNRTKPISVPHLTNVIGVSVGTAHGCAVLREGAIKCWGNNSDGQLGNGDPTSTPVLAPVSVRGISEASDVFAFAAQTCAILRSGRAQCWGKGILGDNASDTSLTPVDVATPGAFLRLAIGPFHVCGVQADSQIVCWGPPTLGGNGTTTGDGRPRRVVGASATAVEIGIYMTFIIEPSGGMKWWDAGTKPAPVVGIARAAAISGWGLTMCQIDLDGVVSCWTTANEAGAQPITVAGVDLW